MEAFELLEGLAAPDFSLYGSDNNQHKLSDYLGKFLVLYFYPKDNTPACSLEAQAFRDNKEIFDKLNTTILGISRDSLKSHESFINKHCLPFILLSDTDEIVCNLYGVLKEKNMYGKKSIGIERSTFIIDDKGIISKIYRKVKVANHIENVLNHLEQL
jgi:peroxiredoxin Q/BCP